MYPIWLAWKVFHICTLLIFLLYFPTTPHTICSYHIKLFTIPWKHQAILCLCALNTPRTLPTDKSSSLLANSCLSFKIQLKHQLLDSPLICIFVVLSAQHLFLLCNTPDFLWGTSFLHCECTGFHCRLIPGFAVGIMWPRPGRGEFWIPLIKRLVQGRVCDPSQVLWFVHELLGIPQQQIQQICTEHWCTSHLFTGNPTINQTDKVSTPVDLLWAPGSNPTWKQLPLNLSDYINILLLFKPIRGLNDLKLKNTNWYIPPPFRCHFSLFNFPLLYHFA